MFLLLKFDNTKDIREIRQLNEPGIIHRRKCEFVKRNMGLVATIAKKYQGKIFPYDDAMQEGCVGMLKALEKFDTERGVQFSTYAHHWIRQSCARAAQDQGSLIRIPAYLHRTNNPAKKVRHVESLDYKELDRLSLLELTPSNFKNELIDDTQALLEKLLVETLTESEYHMIKMYYFEERRNRTKDMVFYRSVQKALRKLRRARHTKYEILREQLRE